MNPSLPETCAIIPSSATTVVLAREPFPGVLLTWGTALGRPGGGSPSREGRPSRRPAEDIAPGQGRPDRLGRPRGEWTTPSAAAGRATHGRAPPGRTSAEPGARGGMTRA